MRHLNKILTICALFSQTKFRYNKSTRRVHHMLNILLCDDDRDIVNALKIYLSAPDRCLLEAHTGR